ncbi:major facilitator superfamily domain-containing protein [Panaeolus papilionaceus]|nr:major facilitator superfamily domain-containing protein [Panaeolus papilionaceus]
MDPAVPSTDTGNKNNETSDGESVGILSDLSEDQVEKLTKSAIRRADLRLLPLLGMLNALSLIDRSNLGLARTAGMGQDLSLGIGARYSIVSCIYFVPYILLELPSNLFLRKLGVVNWLTFLVISWGTVQLAMGFVSTWTQLLLCRVLLGAFEAGFFPALVYIITSWYTRHEVQKRLAALYIVGVFVGGFSAIFAFVLNLLEGKKGISGWSWIFIVEGAITIGFGILGWFCLPTFPEQNTFLTKIETFIILNRVEKDRGDSVPDDVSTRKVVTHLLDWKIWVFGVMYMCTTMPSYAISFFLTLILRGMGWSTSASLLLSAPPYVFASFSILLFSWLSDKYRQRAVFIAIQALISLIGMCLTGYASRPGWRYIGIFLSTAGSGGCIPGILAYSSNNIVSHSKRAVTTAVIVSFGGIGGVFASLVFRQTDAPRYLPGIYATIGCQILLLILLAVITAYYWSQNRIRSTCEGQATQRLGDQVQAKVDFIYTL